MSNEVKDFFDSIAPSWDSMEEKSPEFIQSLIQEIKIKPGDHILDVACGTGVVTGHLHQASNSPVKAIDLSPKMIEIAKQKYRGQSWANFEAVDLFEYSTNEPFDVIVIYNAFPHFLNPESLSKKASSLLRKGGKLAILHSLGREELATHHSGKQVHPISRDLAAPQEEYQSFQKEFELSRAEEGPHHYFLFLTKK